MTQEVELLRRQREELSAQMDEVRQQSHERCDERGSDRTHRSGENNGTVGIKTAPRGHDSREVRAVRTWQRL